MKFIKKTVKALFPKAILHFKAYKELIRNENSYLYSTGWMRSLEEYKPVDMNGNPIPWMNYPMVEFLKQRLKKEHNIFEFGSGFSTLFYSQLVNSVNSVEYDKFWFEKLKNEIPTNITLHYQEKDIDGDYCRTIVETNKFYDIVIVDGRDRVNCVKQSIDKLKPNGCIILDDSQRERYLEGIIYAERKGFRQLSFEGLKSTGIGMDRTTILYRTNNCLGI